MTAVVMSAQIRVDERLNMGKRIGAARGSDDPYDRLQPTDRHPVEDQEATEGSHQRSHTHPRARDQGHVIRHGLVRNAGAPSQGMPMVPIEDMGMAEPWLQSKDKLRG